MSQSDEVRQLVAGFRSKERIAVGIAVLFLLVASLAVVWRVRRTSVQKSSRSQIALVRAKQPGTSAAAPLGQPPAAAVSTASPAQPMPVKHSFSVQKHALVNSPASAAELQPTEATRRAEPLRAFAAADEKNLAENTVTPAHSGETPVSRKRRESDTSNDAALVPVKILSQYNPSIPPWARGLDVGGAVELDALIDENGNLKETKALSGPRVLQKAAERAVELWVFEPATLNGKPIAAHLLLTVQFQK